MLLPLKPRTIQASHQNLGTTGMNQKQFRTVDGGGVDWTLSMSTIYITHFKRRYCFNNRDPFVNRQKANMGESHGNNFYYSCTLLCRMPRLGTCAAEILFSHVRGGWKKQRVATGERQKLLRQRPQRRHNRPQ